MNLVTKKQGIFKRFLDARWAWDLIQGPIYNRLVLKAASELYQRFIGEIQPPENANILDVGSGPGFLTLLLAKENPTVSVVGVDYSPTQVRAADRLRIRNQIHNCSFRQGAAMNLPFQDASFYIVISVASIKHWPEGKRDCRKYGVFLHQTDPPSSERQTETLRTKRYIGSLVSLPHGMFGIRL